MNIGLYFGSFNPIHVGHLIIANYVLQHSKLDKVWFVVSPLNPLKQQASLLNEYDRLFLVKTAIDGEKNLRASNVEFKLPKPSYTIDTLTYLTEKFPDYNFTIIMGGDSYQNLKHWKNWEVLIKTYRILIYERPGFAVNILLNKNHEILKAPLLEISSTYIRSEIKNKRSIRYLVTDAVKEEIEKSGFYRS